MAYVRIKDRVKTEEKNPFFTGSFGFPESEISKPDIDIPTPKVYQTTQAYIPIKQRPAFKFEVGEGLPPTKVLPGPRISTLEATKRGDEIKTIAIKDSSYLDRKERIRTKLTKTEEKQFQTDYKNIAKQVGIDTNPDNPLHKYDYRGAWKTGELGVGENSHFPSTYKDFDHPNRFVNGVDTIKIDRKEEPSERAIARKIVTGSYIPIAERDKPFEGYSLTEVFGDSFRKGVLQTGSAVETIASLGAKKIGDEQLSNKLERLAENDRELSKFGIQVEDTRKFTEKIRDSKYITSGIAMNLPNLLFGMGVATPAAIIGAPAFVVGGLAFLGAGTLEGGFAYQEAKDAGVDDNVANKVASIVGIANGLLEALPITKLLARSPVGKEIKRKIIAEITKRVLKQAGLESGTESVQEIVSNSVATIYDKDRALLSGVPESAFFGGIMGGGVSLGLDVVTNQEVRERVKTAFKSEAGFAKTPEFKGRMAEDKPISKAPKIEQEISKAKAEGKNFEEFVSRKSFVDSKIIKTKSGHPLDNIPSNVKPKSISSSLFKLEKEAFDKTGDNIAYHKRDISAGDPSREFNRSYWVKQIQEGKRPSVLVESLDGQLRVSDGNHRLTAYLQENIKEIPVIFDKSAKSKLKQLWEAGEAKPKIKTGKEQLAEREQAKIDRRQDLLKKESLIFSESELENQYQQFKKIVTPKILDEIEDVIQLKTKLKNKSEEIDNILYSQDKSDDKVFDMFKKRRFDEIIPLTKIPKETKAIVTEKVSQKIKLTAKEQRNSILDKIRNKIGTTEEIRKDVVIYAKENLELRERGKLLATVKNAKTFKDLDKAKLYIEKLSEKANERLFLGKIQKEIKAIKVSGKKPKGKYTPEIQNTLNAIKNLTDLNQKNATIKLEENLKNYLIKVPEEIVMENYLLSLYTGNVKQKQELLSIIRQLKEKGEISSALKKFNIQAEIQAKNDLVIDRVTGGKGIEQERLRGQPADKTKIEKVKQYLKAIGKKTILDWRGLMTTLDFNSSVKKKPLADFFSVSKNESKYKELQSIYKEKFDIAFSSIYDIKNKSNSILKKINKIATEKVKVDKYEMTRDELIKRYMEIQDPTLIDSLIQGNKYTEKTLDAILNKISDKDKKFAEWQLKYYREIYDKVNKIYRLMNGVDLPFNEFYSPIKRVGYKVEPGHTEFLDEVFYRKAVTNKSLTSRVKNLNPILKQGSISVLDKHITDTNYYISWAEKIRELDSVFTNNKVMEAIKQEFPNNILESITNKIQHISTHGNKTASRIGWVDYIRKNYVIGNLAVKPALTVKQLVSTLAYLEKISSVSLISGILDFAKNPVKNYNILKKESAFIKTRGSGMERDIQDALKEGVFSRYNKKQNLANTLILNVKLGDKGAIVLGSWSLRKKRLKQGVKLEDVVSEYEEFGADTQQSADISRLSEIQLGGSIEKLFTVFKSSQRAYLQKEVNAVKSMFRKDGFGKENIKKVAKTMWIYHILLPVLFQWVSNMGGWSEEDRKDYLRAGILGSINGLFIAGDIIAGIIRQILGLRVWDTEVIIADVGDDINKIISNLTEDDVSTKDLQTALDAMASAGTGLTGLPIEYGYDILESLYNENYKTSLLQTLGWSEYTIGKPKKTGTSNKLKEFEDRIKSIQNKSKLKSYEDRIKNIQNNLK